MDDRADMDDRAADQHIAGEPPTALPGSLSRRGLLVAGSTGAVAVAAAACGGSNDDSKDDSGRG